MAHKRRLKLEQVYTATGEWDDSIEQFEVEADTDAEAEAKAEEMMTNGHMVPGGKLIRIVRGDQDDPGLWRENKQPKRLSGPQLKHLVESIIQESVPWHNGEFSYARTENALEEAIEAAQTLANLHMEIASQLMASGIIAADMLDDLDPEFDQQMDDLISIFKMLQDKLQDSATDEIGNLRNGY